MSVDRSSRSSRLGSVPLDLAVILAVTILVNVAVFVPIIRTSSIRVPLGLFFVFFVPGYVLVATLFPEARRSVAGANASRSDSPSTESRTEIDYLERLVLSFGASVAMVPGVALLLNYTPWGTGPISVLVASTIVTLFLTATATVRRLRLPEAERFRVPLRRSMTRLRNEVIGPTDRAEMVLTALLVASILLAAGGVAYAVTTPADGERFSEVYVLSENDDGELVADDYPTEFDAGESRELVFGIDNNEHETTEYSVVVVEQDVESDGDELEVDEQREIDRFDIQLDHGATWQQQHDVEPTITGENVRIVWLVYLDGDVPSDPSMENAAYQIHLWIDVDEPNDDSP